MIVLRCSAGITQIIPGIRHQIDRASIRISCHAGISEVLNLTAQVFSDRFQIFKLVNGKPVRLLSGLGILRHNRHCQHRQEHQKHYQKRAEPPEKFLSHFFVPFY